MLRKQKGAYSPHSSQGYKTMTMQSEVFSYFSIPIQKAIADKGFSAPTESQIKAIPLIMAGRNVLLIAPTASGKTEAAFLPVADALIREKPQPHGIKVLYITPLKALNRDMLLRLQWWCKRLDLRLGVRHGDTTTKEREAQAMVPPDVLITTPETLQALLTGRIMRQHLASVKWVIVDEVHELACDKRGSQLALALERLRYLKRGDFQLIGLSATIGSPERVARFLVGTDTERDCEVVNVPVSRSMQIEVYYPEVISEDYKLANELYTYPEVAARLRVIRNLIEEHKSTLIFTNTRSLAEILGSRFRVWDLNFPVGVHHGSLSKLSRITAERGIKEGKLHGIICTSSLELGIDVGRLDFVIQYNSPRQVTRLLQRIGRSGHRIGGIASGAIIVQDSDDALEALVICRRALAEELEPAEIPMKSLDVLAHQIAGLLMLKRSWSFDEALSLIRRAYPYSELEERELVSVLQYMHSRIPRLVWFSASDRIFTRPKRIKPLYSYYFEHLSMIPEEKHYLVIEESSDNPVGVLDEAFVAEYGSPGNKFIESGRVWKILHLYGDRIYVKEEEDPTGSVPSWVGEEIPVPYAVANEVGELRRKVAEELERGVGIDAIAEELTKKYPCSKDVALSAIDEVLRQVERGYPVPTDKQLTVERCNGYIILHCAFGLRVNRTLGMLLATHISDRTGTPVGVQQDPYRISLRTELALEDVEAIIHELSTSGSDDIKKQALRALLRSRLFKRRFIHVARRFGAISRDASLTDLDLESLIRGFEGSAVFEEAIRESRDKDIDIELTAEALKRVETGELKIALLRSEECSPIASIPAMISGYELIPPQRMHRVILKYVLARLLDEELTFVCTNCLRFVAVKRIKDIGEEFRLGFGLRCPECGSTRIGALKVGEEEVRREIRKNKKSMVAEANQSADLIARYGKAALLALAGRGLGIGDAREILKQESKVNEHLVELIASYEKEILKRKFYKRHG